jgi:3-methyladenine DNA glycosylase Tag
MTQTVSFEPIYAAAVRRVGDEATLLQRLSRPEPPEALAMVGDDRYLSVMSRRIFRAGLKHSMVDARWPAFERAFYDFDIDSVASLNDDDLKAYFKDDALIRHRGKLTAVRDNARAIQLLAQSHGCVGSWLALWPVDEIVDLWDELRARFKQLGGNSGPAFLRMVGKDTFLLTDWVIKALNHWDVYEGKPKGKRAQQALQHSFSGWLDETDWAYS